MDRAGNGNATGGLRDAIGGMMRDINPAREYLEKIRRQKFTVEQIEFEIYQLRNGENYLKSQDLQATRISGSKNSDIAETMCKIEEYTSRIKKELGDLLNMKIKARELIQRIKDPAIEAVLMYRYVNCLEWEQITIKMQYSISPVFKMHREGICKLNQILEKDKKE